MNLRKLLRNACSLWILTLCSTLGLTLTVAAQTADSAGSARNADLEYVVMLSRHGVRSPLNKPGELDKYSAAPWPSWEVRPGYLTPHGYTLMRLFGEWDRTKFTSDGLFSASGCADAAHVTIDADSDERTVQTGKGLAEGMFPGCAIVVHAQAEGTVDPLFRIPLFSEAGSGRGNPALAAAAIAGRIGGNAQNVTEAYRPQLLALDRVLAGCGREPSTNSKRDSILDLPASIGASGASSALHGPISLGSGMVENLLLEYTDGMKDVGWGCVDGDTLRALMQLDTVSWELSIRTHTIAQMYASNILDHIVRSMEQHVSGKALPGALGQPGDRLLLVVGHDTNIETVAGMLGLNWIIDGRVDDTPPGGALLFELWRSRTDGRRFVRMEYTAQTLEQMRQAQPLSPANPPASAPIFVPACSGKDMSCSWPAFDTAMHGAINPAYVTKQR
jgi:4-phytase / acid phosphatase